MTDREDFELKISRKYEQPSCLDRDGEGYADSYVDNAWWGWQAASAIDAKRIAELDAKLNVDFPLIVKLFERIDELETREKVLVEALEVCKYDCNTGEIIGIAREALAKVKNESDDTR